MGKWRIMTGKNCMYIVHSRKKKNSLQYKPEKHVGSINRKIHMSTEQNNF